MVEDQPMTDTENEFLKIHDMIQNYFYCLPKKINPQTNRMP